MKWKQIFCTAALLAAMIPQARALEYSFDGPEDYLFAASTSTEDPYRAENPNVDRSKNVVLAAPGFGTATSYLPGSGEYLTPNLVPGALSGGLVNQVGAAYSGSTINSTAGTVTYPSADSAAAPTTSGSTAVSDVGIIYPTVDVGISTAQTIAFTEVTSSLYYSGGYLGTLKIPALGLNVKIYEGTDSATLAKGAGHFIGTSIWNGNVCIA